MSRGLSDILLLGNPTLYEISSSVQPDEMSMVNSWVADLANAMNEIRLKYNFGRGIAAPQLGIMKRLIYIDTGVPRIIINPEILSQSDEMFLVWDDCMCFPNLLVKVYRHKEYEIEYIDEHSQKQTWLAKVSDAELLQHEMDHLDGILCTMRAVDAHSFRWRS